MARFWQCQSCNGTGLDLADRGTCLDCDGTGNRKHAP